MNKKLTIFIVVIVIAVGGYFAYMNWAFPPVRCEAAKHLTAEQNADDCYACHAKATAQLAQEWKESKHGINTVTCQTCHGLPDGTGANPFARNPDVSICARCHSANMERMEAKFGKRDDCNTCHPHHQSTMHGQAYVFNAPSTKN